ncbi:MAG TPA: hypothetical protein VF885_22120 [Arthrobacter sp.]
MSEQNQNREASGRFGFKELKPANIALGTTEDFDADLPDIGRLTQDEIRGLAESPDDLVRADLTSSIRIPDDVLERLSEPDQSVSVRLATANTGYPGTADRAAADEDPLVRAAAYGSWDLSPADRNRLRSDAKVQRLMGMIAR